MVPHSQFSAQTETHRIDLYAFRGCEDTSAGVPSDLQRVSATAHHGFKGHQTGIFHTQASFLGGAR